MKKFSFFSLFKFVSGVVVVAIVSDPRTYIGTCTTALSLFATSVLPVLLPFMFFTSVLFERSKGKSLGLCSFLFGTSACSDAILLSSFIAGYPMGAKTTAEFVENGKLPPSDVETVSAFSSTSGPMFVLGTVGSVFFKSTEAGIIILVSHLLSAILTGLVFRKKKGNENTVGLSQPKRPFSETVSLCASRTVSGILNVGLYIVVFYVLTEVLVNVGVISLLSLPFSLLGVEEKLVSGTIIGAIEMTRGISVLSSSSSVLSIPLATAVLSFGGASVVMQSLAFLGKYLSPKSFFLRKAVQTVFAFFVSSLICLFYPL